MPVGRSSPTRRPFRRSYVACDALFGCRCAVTGCSRTDAGVHAREFLCTVAFEGEPNAVPADRVPPALNALLPESIAVASCAECSDSFHPRYGIRGKEYVYLLHNSRIRDPFLAGRAFRFPAPLDVNAMSRCAKEFTGRHDFAAFMSSGSKIEDTRRTVFDFTVTEKDGLITFTVSADGFLYNMVRIMVGTLIDAGLGKKTPDDVRRIIESKDRASAGATVPAHGLYLNRILKGDDTP